MKFKHFILTRFNLGLYDKNNPYAEKVGDPDEWMKHRSKLFDKCVISILDQTNKNFTWVIAVDPATFGTIKINEKSVNVNFVTEQPHVWLKRQQIEASWIITSRIDNDDIYFPNFVESIQSNFREQEEIIDIDYEVLESKTGNKYPSMRPRANSPFLSLVEPWTDNITTAMGKPHTIMPEFFNSRKLGVLATQVIHEKNVSNKIP